MAETSATPPRYCCLTQSNIQTDVLSPLFLVLTYGISFCSTLWFYNRKRQLQEESHSIPFSLLELAAAQTDVDNRVEIIKYSTNSNESEGLWQNLI